MVATEFTTLRDLVIHHATRRGWRTQRRIAVTCGLDETAFSRFLDGKQDIGAVATFELFRAIRVPVELYPLAFELLGCAQAFARLQRGERMQPPPIEAEARLELAREFHDAAPRAALHRAFTLPPEPAALPSAAPAADAAARPAARRGRWRLLPGGWRRRQAPVASRRDVWALAYARGIGRDGIGTLPTNDLVWLFRAEGFTGTEIAAFFAHARRDERRD